MSTLHSPICSAGFQWTSSGHSGHPLDFSPNFHPIFVHWQSSWGQIVSSCCPVPPKWQAIRHPLAAWSTGCPRGLLDHPGWTSTGCLFDYPGSPTGEAPQQKSGHGKLWLCYFDIWYHSVTLIPEKSREILKKSPSFLFRKCDVIIIMTNLTCDLIQSHQIWENRKKIRKKNTILLV